MNILRSLKLSPAQKLACLAVEAGAGDRLIAKYGIDAKTLDGLYRLGVIERTDQGRWKFTREWTKIQENQ